MRRLVKHALNAGALVSVAVAAATSDLERRLDPDSEALFTFWAQAFAFPPGRPGVYLRRAYYRLSLRSSSLDCYIGFGALVSHRQAVIEEDVYVGPYAIVGSARLCRGCLVGSRASVLSGGALHELRRSSSRSPSARTPGLVKRP
jgi:hypothetical protein